jgi:hypothetical protein
MRYVSSIPTAYVDVGGREVKDNVRTVKPVQPHAPGGRVVMQHRQYELQQKAEPHEWHEVRQEERRLVCRRVSHQSVLLELRSGMERRHHNLRAGDIVEHIDEEV